MHRRNGKKVALQVVRRVKGCHRARGAVRRRTGRGRARQRHCAFARHSVDKIAEPEVDATHQIAANSGIAARIVGQRIRILVVVAVFSAVKEVAKVRSKRVELEIACFFGDQRDRPRYGLHIQRRCCALCRELEHTLWLWLSVIARAINLSVTQCPPPLDDEFE